MKVLRVYPKDLYVEYEQSLTQLKYILEATDGAHLTCTNPKAVEYFREFYKTLDKLVDELEKDIKQNGPSGDKTEKESP